MTEAEIGARQLQAKEHRGFPATTEAGRGRKDFPPTRGFRRSRAMLTPWFQTSSLRNRENKRLLFEATLFVALCYSIPSKLMSLDL